MSLLDPLRPIPPLTAKRLLVAVSAPLLATLLTYAFLPLLARNVSLLFLCAVLVSALYGGLWGGLLAALLAGLGSATVVFEPIGRPFVSEPLDIARVAGLVLFSIVVSVLAQALLVARRRAEQRAAEAAAGEESFRALFDSTADAIYVASATGRLLNVNEAALTLHGFTREEMIGRSWESFMDAELNDMGVLRSMVEAAYMGQTQSYEAWVRHASGRSIPLDVKLTGARYFGREVIIAVARDVSERRRLEAQLRQSQKMDAVGRLAGGVAHDFNNLLTSIRGYASLMRDRVAHDATLLEDLDEIERAVELATAVTGQLLAFSRKQDYLPKAVSLNQSLERMESLLRRLIGERVELIVEMDPELGLSMLDEGQVEQVIMNLVVNARDAVRGGGRIVIRTRNAALGSPPAPYVMVSVTDDGIGMDESTRARIFEPFFTTKEAGHGTGLGLSTVYGIVKQSGGTIEVESAPGKGATFSVLFPRIDSAAAARPAGTRPAAAEASPAAPAGPGERGERTILLAEDEAPVRHLVRRILTRRGYRVIEASNGREAFDLASLHPHPIDALVTDVVMPELTGPELAERLRVEHPDLPVLFTSGYNEEGMDGTGVVSGLGIAFLQKPFAPEELLRLLAELLEPSDRAADDAATRR